MFDVKKSDKKQKKKNTVHSFSATTLCLSEKLHIESPWISLQFFSLKKKKNAFFDEFLINLSAYDKTIKNASLTCTEPTLEYYHKNFLNSARSTFFYASQIHTQTKQNFLLLI